MNRDVLTARLRALFVAELEDRLETLNADLLSLEANPGSAERLDSVFRVFHTLKGAAHAAAVPQVETVCHAAEALLVRAREGALLLGPEEFRDLFAVADSLADAARRLKEGRELTASPLAEPRRAGDPPASAPPAAAPEDPGTDRTPTAVSGSTRPPANDPARDTPPRPVPSGAHGGDGGADQVRVDTDKLDGLLTAGGELLLAAGRVAARPRELAELHEVATRCRAGWARAARELRGLVRRGSTSAPTLRVLEQVERDLHTLVEDSDRLATALAGDARSLSNVATAVGQRIRGLRLRPFSEACTLLPRAIRDLASSTGKDVRFEVVGGDVEADRAVIDSLQEALLHLVRNAVDHGIETSGERIRLGKPPAGTIAVGAVAEGNRLRVTVHDDGRGLDLPAIRTHLRKRGLEAPDRPEDLAQALFQPGFSTRDEATKVSGRGIGLDIVRSTIERIHGSIQVGWEEGSGTTFTLECPPSVSALRALLVRVGGQVLALPSTHVEGLLRLPPAEIRRAQGRDVIQTLGPPLPIVSLASLLGPPLPNPAASDFLLVIRLRAGARELAVVVDELLAVEEIVVRQVERLSNPPAYLAGATLLPDGRIALVLNAASLIDSAFEDPAAGVDLAASGEPSPTDRRILVIDDSLTTRALEKSILQAEGFDVLTATDGQEGWQLLQERPVDLVVSDIDMPRMSGLQLCRAIRSSDRLARLPVILVTAQESAEYRQLGLEAGADAYLPKSSFDQQSLLDTIRQLIG